MTLPVSGAISFNAINVELGVAGTTTANINQASYRTLAGVPSGTISLSNFYGKSNRVALSYTFSANTANATLNLSGLSGYVAGGSDITVTINSGIYLYATSTANAGLTLTGGTTGDTLTIVNNGNIMGMGGSGVDGFNGAVTATGRVGGTALSIPINATINNTNASAYIAGGGGSGGGFNDTGSGYGRPASNGGGAGGAGGGKAGNSYLTFAVVTLTGGAGGAIGSSGANGTFYNSGGYLGASAGGGGRVLPSTSTTLSASGSGAAGLGGSGGGTGGTTAPSDTGTRTSTGGGPNTAGTGTSIQGAGGGNTYLQGAGGGYGASGAPAYLDLNANASGGAGGKAVALNGKTVTWVSGNTTRVYGAVS